MFKFFKEIPNGDLSSYTLILPAVSVGNVGQLAADLLIMNLKNCKKVGRLFHPGLEPVVGNDISEDGQVSLMTSCEIFHEPDSKLMLLQFHAPVLSKRTEEFVTFLVDWIKERKFERVICLSSTFASERIDSQLTGPPFRYLTSSSINSALQDIFESLKWKKLEGRQFPAPPVYSDSDSPSISGEIYIPGSGITRQLIDSCEASGVPIATLLMFVSEGDNTQDAKLYFAMLNQLFKWVSPLGGVKGNKEAENLGLSYVKTPPSWIHLFGPSYPPEIY